MPPESPLFQPVPWTTRDVWLGLAAFGLWLAAFVAAGLLLQALPVAVDLGLLVSLGELLLLLPVWRLTVRKYGAGWESLGLRGFPARALALALGLMLFSFAFNFGYDLFLQRFNLQMQVDLVPVFAELSSPWLLLLGGAVIAPVVEEIFFRGFIFAGLRARYGWQKSALISAALFALFHFTPTAILPIFLLGYIFAFLYRRSGSIWPSILMHMLTNSLALGAAYFLANAGAWGLPAG